MLTVSNVSCQKGNQQLLKTINFSLPLGESLAIVGESGSGKTTLAKIIVGLETAFTGQVSINNQTLTTTNSLSWYQNIQIITQNTSPSLNPKKTVAYILTEPLIHLLKVPPKERAERVTQIMQAVGLPLSLLNRRMRELSGGEYQRVAIARALIIRPQVLVCDEITSSLDKIHEQQILTLLNELKQEYQFSLLFITHNLAIIAQIVQHVIVLQQGACCDFCSITDLFNSERSLETKKLVDSVFVLQNSFLNKI